MISREAAYLLALLLALAALPLWLGASGGLEEAGSIPLVVITPHNEAIRYEYGKAFEDWMLQKSGKKVRVDWRNIGGTSEIARYLTSQYTAAFRADWTSRGKPWSAEIANNFNNPKINPDDNSLSANVRESRKDFLASQVGIGIDLFFGGGEYDHTRQAAMGHLVASGFRETDLGKEILGSQLPERISGEKWHDPDDRWYGATVSSFGICYNEDVLACLPGVKPPEAWIDLCQPGLFGRIALADPMKSGSSAKAFEMVIQQEMAKAVSGIPPDSTGYAQALSGGWKNGLNVVRLASANARYFTDAGSKPTLDIAMGDAAAGMCIDFYGMYQAALIARPDGKSRMRYITPPGGATVGCDPIAMLRGAPHREVALDFIIFVLSMEGQRLWAWKPGIPGGPRKYALQRLPIRKDFYTPENLKNASNPDLNPFVQAETFTYHGEWTGKLFNAIRMLIRAMCMDAGPELREAWGAILDHGGAQEQAEAMALLTALPEEAALENIQKSLGGVKNKVEEIRLMRAWAGFFIDHYHQARDAAQTTRPPS